MAPLCLSVPTTIICLDATTEQHSSPQDAAAEVLGLGATLDVRESVTVCPNLDDKC